MNDQWLIENSEHILCVMEFIFIWYLLGQVDKAEARVKELEKTQ